jgi:hypothetical protein
VEVISAIEAVEIKLHIELVGKKITTTKLEIDVEPLVPV